MKRYTFDELNNFIYRADSAEKCDIAREYIERLEYLSEGDKAHLLLNLEDWAENFDDFDDWDGPDDRRDYGPSNPWDAPGMRVSDFITGVRCW